MAWVRVGDEALSHPKLMGIYDVDGGDRFSPLTVFGFLMALATYSAKHLTDGIIERGAAFKTGDARSTVTSLIDVCVAAGLLAWVDIEGVRKLKMFTSEEFIHIQPKEEVLRRRARSRENRDPAKKSAVIFRDGDRCRYCRKVVRWTGPLGFNLGTLDHLAPDSVGDAPIEGLVVACHECNSARQRAREAFEEANPLLPPPTAPYYGEWSADFLRRHGYTVKPTVDPGRPCPPASDAPTQGTIPGQETTAPVDPGLDGPGSALGSREEVDPGAPDQRTSAGPSTRDPAPPSRGGTEEADPGASTGCASAGPSEVRTESGLSPDSSPTLKGVRSVFLGSGRAGPGGDGKARRGPGRAGTGRPGEGRAGHGRPGPEGPPRTGGDSSQNGANTPAEGVRRSRRKRRRR